MIVIREAMPADAPALARLRWEFRSPRATPVESEQAFHERCVDWMRGELSSGGWRAWVAENDATAIVGQLWMHVIQKVPNPAAELERHAYISNVYVTPAARGGVGGRLLEAALSWARANAIDQIVLWPTERSRALYARHGFTATDEVLGLKC
jgi:GNAT superfamily N-acetyltransferase